MNEIKQIMNFHLREVTEDWFETIDWNANTSADWRALKQWFKKKILNNRNSKV